LTAGVSTGTQLLTPFLFRQGFEGEDELRDLLPATRSIAVSTGVVLGPEP
jgi:hypothetical protein